MARIGGKQLTVDGSRIGQNGKIGPWSGALTPMMRTDIDGQWGITPSMRTLNAMNPYVPQNVQCFVLELPRLFGWLEGGREMALALKAVMETGSEKIEGLNQTLKAEYEEAALGPVEKFHTFVRTTRERSEPQHTYLEKAGLAVGRIIHTWITMGMADPITGRPGIISLRNAGSKFGISAGQAHQAYTLTPENIAMTCLYIEADPTGCFPVLAYLCANMMPDTPGEWTSSSDRQSSHGLRQNTLTFTCTQEISIGVDNLAAQVLSIANKTGLSSMHRRAYIGDNYAEAADAFVKTAQTTAQDGSGRALGQVGILPQAEAIGNTENIDKMSGAVAKHNTIGTGDLT